MKPELYDGVDRDVVYSLLTSEVYHYAGADGLPVCNVADFGDGDSEIDHGVESQMEKRNLCAKCEQAITMRTREDIVLSIKDTAGLSSADADLESYHLTKEDCLELEELLKRQRDSDEGGENDE